MLLKRSFVTKKNVIYFRNFSDKSFHKLYFSKKKWQEKEETPYIQLKHSDSSSKFDKTGIMKRNNWPKKKESLKKNELYLFQKKKGEQIKQINFRQLNIQITRKINNMQNLNEIYKYIYYNKDILVPINYVICIYKIYKLVKNKNLKIENYEKEISKIYMNADIEKILQLCSFLNEGSKCELYHEEERNEQQFYENTQGSHLIKVTDNNSKNLNKNHWNAFILNYKNDILQYILVQVTKRYFIKHLTYRHISNLLFALANIKYYNLHTYLIYANYINTNIYLYFTSQSISNVAYAYSIIINFYAIDLSNKSYNNDLCKYYYFNEKWEKYLNKDPLNLMFLLLSRQMCIHMCKYLNNNYEANYDLNAFYEDGNMISSFKELNEKEKKSEIWVKRKYESKEFLKEIFIFLWSLSKIKIHNIYIDLLYYMLYRNRKNIVFKINEKDACNWIQSVSIYYPLQIGTDKIKVHLLKGNESIFLNHNVLLKNTLLVILLHSRKCNYYQYSIILKSIKILQKCIIPSSQKADIDIESTNSCSFTYNIVSSNNIKMMVQQNNDWKNGNCNKEQAQNYYCENKVIDTDVSIIKIQKILKKITMMIINNTYDHMLNEKYSYADVYSNLQYMSVFLYIFSQLSPLFIKNELTENLLNLIVSKLEKQLKLLSYFEVKYINSKIPDSSFLEKCYDNVISLSNINYALNKMNKINESIILYSSFYFYKLYHLFYKVAKNISDMNFFFQIVKKINERILSIWNWTISHSGISFMPLFSVINYNYLYLIYSENENKTKLQFLKKVLIPMTLYNHVTISQLRLMLKMFVHFYIIMFLKETQKTNFSDTDTFCIFSKEIEEDLLNCLYSLSLIITNILHNIQEETNEDTKNDSQNTNIYQQKKRIVHFYTDIITILLANFFHKIYCDNKELVYKKIRNDSIINAEIVMKFYTLYLFLKYNYRKNDIYNHRKYIKKILSHRLISEKEMEIEEEMLSMVCQDNYKKTEETFLEQQMKYCNFTEKEQNVEHHQLESIGIIANETLLERHINKIYNKNFKPEEQSLKIFYLFQQNIHPSELKYNKNVIRFFRDGISLVDITVLNNEMKSIENEICKSFRNITSSNSHLKLSEYIKNVLRRKKNDTEIQKRDIEGDTLHTKKETEDLIDQNIINEYIINKHNLLFVVDIYDSMNNIIFEVNGKSHFTKQFWLNQKQMLKQDFTKKNYILPFHYYYNYKCYYIFKHILLNKCFQVVHLPAENTKLCRRIIKYCYSI